MLLEPKYGALVVSLDFELHWGVRDHRPLDEAERKRLLAARAVIPKILSVFEENAISATWATVGLLFAGSREEAEEFRPARVPNYREAALSPYGETLGKNEAEDPFHFAPSLIAQIAGRRGQEIGSHSFSHYYSLEEGQGEEEFGADLDSAKRIAAVNGYRLESYVFARNQVRRDYLPILRRAGFRSYRGTETAPSKAAVNFRKQRNPTSRLLRLMDAYWDVNGEQTVSWPVDSNPFAVDASRYLRPYTAPLRGLEGQRLRRISSAMQAAAIKNRIFHLWWHPEDFAHEQDRNLDFLQRVLTIFRQCQRDYGMVSLSMGDVAGSVANKGLAYQAQAGGSR